MTEKELVKLALDDAHDTVIKPAIDDAILNAMLKVIEAEFKDTEPVCLQSKTSI